MKPFMKLVLEKVSGIEFRKHLNIHGSLLHVIDGGDSGLDEEEYQAAVATLQSLATTIDADMVLLRQRKVEKGQTGQYLIRKRVDTSDFMEIR